MTTEQVVKTSATVKNDPIKDNNHPDAWSYTTNLLEINKQTYPDSGCKRGQFIIGGFSLSNKEVPSRKHTPSKRVVIILTWRLH